MISVSTNVTVSIFIWDFQTNLSILMLNTQKRLSMIVWNHVNDKDCKYLSFLHKGSCTPTLDNKFIIQNIRIQNIVIILNLAPNVIFFKTESSHAFGKWPSEFNLFLELLRTVRNKDFRAKKYKTQIIIFANLAPNLDFLELNFLTILVNDHLSFICSWCC